MSVAASRFNDCARLDIGKPDFIRLDSITESIVPMTIDLQSESYHKAVTPVYIDGAVTFDLSSEISYTSLNRVSIAGTIDLSGNVSDLVARFVISVAGTIDLSSYESFTSVLHTPENHNLYFDETARLDKGRLDFIRLDNFVKSELNTIELQSNATLAGRQIATIGGTIDLSSSISGTFRHIISAPVTIELQSNATLDSGFSVPIGGTIDLSSEWSLFTSLHKKAIGGAYALSSNDSFASRNKHSCGGTIDLSSYAIGTFRNWVVCYGTIELSSEMEVAPIYSYVAIELSGPFAPGDTIVIDCEKYSVMLNGVNILDRVTGDFPTIIPGDNEIRYIDSETSRTVTIKTMYSERFV